MPDFKYLLTVLAIMSLMAGTHYAAYSAGQTDIENKHLENDNKALIDYAKEIKAIADNYKPIYQKIDAAGKDRGCTDILDITIDSLPAPRKSSR